MKASLQQRLEAAAFGAVLAHFAALPLEEASRRGARLGALLGPRLSAHRTALRNLRLAFPASSAAERYAIALGMWRNIGATLAELPHLPALRLYEQPERFEIIGAQRLDAVQASGRGAVFVSGHFANWELMAAALAQRGLAVHVAYRAPNNPLVDARINAIRRGYGLALLQPKGRAGGAGLLRGLSRGESIAILNDQKQNDGLAADLFGHQAMTADGGVRLALRFEAPVIPLSLRRLGGARFRLEVHEALAFDRSGPAAVLRGVQAINRFLEARIREAPEQWFWVHRRWPKSAWAAAGVR